MVFDLALIDFLMGCEKNIKKNALLSWVIMQPLIFIAIHFSSFILLCMHGQQLQLIATNCAMRCSKYYGNCCSYTSCAVYICIVCNTSSSYISSNT